MNMTEPSENTDSGVESTRLETSTDEALVSGKRKKCGIGRFFAKLLSGCMFSAFAFCLVLLLIFIFCVNGCNTLVAKSEAAATEQTDHFVKQESARMKLADTTTYSPAEYPEDTEAVVLHLTLRGIISSSSPSGLFELRDMTTAASVLTQVRRAICDDGLDGIFLEIDSPGGEVTASDVLWNALCEFKKSKPGRFVVVHMGATCCSGGYYIAVAADRIFAHPTTMTGSIGVKLSAYNIKELAQKLGIREVSLASGANKNMLTPFEDITPEQEQLLRAMLQQTHDRFVGIVSTGRNLPEAQVRPLADGRIFTAKDAKQSKLVDEIGYLKDSAAAVHKLANARTVTWVNYAVNFEFKSIFSSSILGSSLRQIFPQLENDLTLQFR